VTVGIDPGVTGAVSIIGGGMCEVHDLPMLRVHSKAYVNSPELLSLLQRVRPKLIVVELAGARQRQGVSSITQTWLVYGGVVATALSTGCTLEIVHPLKWKRRLGLLGADKEASRLKALQLFPKLGQELKRKKDHNRAEALLLAHYGLSVH